MYIEKQSLNMWMATIWVIGQSIPLESTMYILYRIGMQNARFLSVLGNLKIILQDTIENNLVE